jgi:hypothetical protein
VVVPPIEVIPFVVPFSPDGALRLLHLAPLKCSISRLGPWFPSLKQAREHTTPPAQAFLALLAVKVLRLAKAFV